MSLRLLAAFALAIRLFPYRTEGTWNLWPTIGLTLFGLLALAVTYYVVVALEILKYGHLRKVGLLTFGGRDKHKGYALSLMIQTLGAVAGAAIPHGRARDYGHLFIAFRPDLLMPIEQMKAHVDQLIAEIKATPTQDGVDAVRIPSERSFRVRDEARRDGLLIDRKVADALKVMAAGGKVH
jgi:hypothetical protein